MENKLRIETELRLLVTAAVTDDISLREKILDFPYYTTKSAQRIAERFTEVFVNDPNADYSVLVSALGRDEQLAMIDLMNNSISQEINELSVDGVLQKLRSNFIEETMRRRISELMISDECKADTLRAILEEAEELAEINKELEQMCNGDINAD